MKFQKLGKYTLLEQIAVGGMAEIHLAFDSGEEGVQKFCAIKQILTDYSDNDEFINMFKEEAEIASQLNHSNIVNIFDFGVDKGSQFYIVMEFVHGKNLKQIVQALESENRKLPVEFIAYIIKEVANGLDYAHKAIDIHTNQPLNIIHRDISPQNIMVSYNGEIKVIDFGIAKSATKLELTGSGTLKGKFGYMSPEQVRGEAMDNRADLFSLGVVSWELLANKRLFASETELETIDKVKLGSIPDLSELNDPKYTELIAIVNRCLANDKEKRFSTGQEISEAINIFLSVHYPEFNKHVFSDYLKNAFFHSFEKSQEKLDKYGSLKITAEDAATETNISGLGEPMESRTTAKLAVSSSLVQDENDNREIEIKKGLRWMYGAFTVFLLILIYFVGYEIPRRKAINNAGVVTSPEMNKSNLAQVRQFEIPFENIAEMTSNATQGCVKTEFEKTFCWGDNRFHQLGVITNRDYVQLLEMTTFPAWKNLSLGLFHSCGVTITKSGNQDRHTLMCWGDNGYGQLGGPTQQNVESPTIVDSTTQYQAISVGLYHSCGLTFEGIAKCWGRGDFNQLGLLNTLSSKVPLIVDSNRRFKFISSGSYHTCAITAEDKLRCWGLNNFGQLGNGQIQPQGSLGEIDPETKYKTVALGEYHTCGLTQDDKVKCWGNNDFGQIGIGHKFSVLNPKFISDNLKFKKIKLGKFHTCAVTLEDELYCWGRNNYFQISNKEIPQFLKPKLTIKLGQKSDFLLGEFSTCFSMPGKLACRGHHWIQNTRSPAEAK